MLHNPDFCQTPLIPECSSTSVNSHTAGRFSWGTTGSAGPPHLIETDSFIAFIGLRDIGRTMPLPQDDKTRGSCSCVGYYRRAIESVRF